MGKLLTVSLRTALAIKQTLHRFALRFYDIHLRLNLDDSPGRKRVARGILDAYLQGDKLGSESVEHQIVSGDPILKLPLVDKIEPEARPGDGKP